jgi:hypothetical protein
MNSLVPPNPIQRVLLYRYLLHQHQARVSSYAYQGGCKNATLQCMDFIYFKLQYKKNTAIDDKVYSKISKVNVIYQVFGSCEFSN